MNFLTGNPFVTMSDGTEKISVPSTMLPEIGDQFNILGNAAHEFPSLFPNGAPGFSSDSQPSTASQVASGVAAAAQTAASVATGGGIPAPGGLGITVSSAITVIVGILFLAAGIFSFKGARDTIITTAKTAAVA